MWQPIETAPRDRFILLWCPEDQSIWWARWTYRWHGADQKGNSREGMGPEDVTGWKVTHWMLPEPPRGVEIVDDVLKANSAAGRRPTPRGEGEA